MAHLDIEKKIKDILYDRGIMDNKCYMPLCDFYSLLEKHRTNEMQVKSRYDAVFHLVTAADGAEEYYTTGNNTARKESVEEARILDKKCIAAWNGHPHFRIIDNSTNFEEKIKRLLAQVYSAIGDPIPVEIERKFLIKKESIDFLSRFCSVTVCDIIQFYLKKQNGFERRIRCSGIDGNYSYFYTQKKKAKTEGRIELEKKISSKEYLRLLAEEVDPNLKCIKKKRVCLVYDYQYIEIDLFDFSDDKAIMEIELTDMSQKINLPDFIKVIKEVTKDDKYSNYNLAKVQKFE
jgi:CYTH domain-containing protein